MSHKKIHHFAQFQKKLKKNSIRKCQHHKQQNLVKNAIGCVPGWMKMENVTRGREGAKKATHIISMASNFT